ncbi:hypothetical protein [Streptomyces canus]|uniref:hypothetical protein n=1 Tax=Streptomyces canus TaxID=58343 RepID=UPI0036EA2A1A
MRRRRTAVPAGTDSASHRHDAGARGDDGTTRLRRKSVSKAAHLPGVQERQAL